MRYIWHYYALFLLVYLGTCTTLKAQHQLKEKYTFHFINNNIYQAIDSIRGKTNLGISFNPDILPSNISISAVFYNKNLSYILDSTFKTFLLSYKLIGSTIAITPGSHKSKIQPDDSIRQEDTAAFYFVSGMIRDDKSGHPIGFANIFLKNKALGTISNTDGNFLLKIPRELVNDSVHFSFVGYQMVSRKIHDLKHTGNIISMKEAIIRLKEVVIRNIKADDLIKKAIEKIPDNYSSKPYIATAFYRETIKEDRDYVALSEAVLKIFKSAYDNYQVDHVNIFKARKSPFVKKMDTVLFKFQGGIHTSLMLDIAKNHSNFISGENFNLYNYKFSDFTTIQGHNAYIIDFDQKDYINLPLFKGKIYIDMESLAIIGAEFMLSPKGIDYASETMVRRSPRKVKVKPVEANYLVRYTERDNIWYLSNVREQVKFKVKKRYTFYSKTFESVAEMVITQTDSLDLKQFRQSGETIRTNDIFTDKISTYDADFWGNYNIIKPDESLEEAFNKIKDKLIQ